MAKDNKKGKGKKGGKGKAGTATGGKSNLRPSGRAYGAPTGGAKLAGFSASMDQAHAFAVAHLDLVGQAPMDHPVIEPTMPTPPIATDGDMSQVLYCKLFHLNNYRKELLLRDADGQNVTDAYAEATNEANECLAKIQTISGALAVLTFPTADDIQKLTAAMNRLETAVANAANLTLLINVAHMVITTIRADQVPVG